MAKRSGRLSGKAARRNSPWTKRRNQVIAGAVVLVVVGAGALSIALDDSSGGPAAAESLPGDKWKEGITFDLSRMSQGSLDYLKQINDWREDKVKDAALDVAASSALDKYLEARELLSVRTAFDQAPRALANYQDAVELYIAHARLAKLGSVVKDEALQEQIQRTMGRIRYLADRMYDLGGTELTPYTFQLPETAGFEFQKPVDVPTFAGTDLAPGPPLAAPRPVSAAERKYQEDRPETELDAWIATVSAAKVPTTEAETKALSDGTPAQLSALAEEFTAASDALYAAADPRDERALNTRIQLGLLVQSEAMRAGQIALLVAAGNRTEAKEIAQSLALLGNRMWDDRLGVRELGLPTSLLTTRPKVSPDVPEGDFVNPARSPQPPARPVSGATAFPTTVPSPAPQ